ncbi:type II secretion system protein GspM [Legionella sp. W05-934-2]|uniref:type II secretion system protein GspM n=1 Tax=Legionella sp. W05-934-2 TaxID=1198649 RepID=UPI003463376F
MIKSHFEQMNPRERWLVGMTVVLVVIYLFYLFIYEPLTTAYSEASKQLQEKRETLAWMNQVKHYAGKSSKQAVHDTSQLLSILTQQLSESSLKPFPYQLQQSSGGHVQLSYEKVPFNPFIEWLIAFQATHAITIDRLSANKHDQEGMVKLTVVFKP